MTLECHENVKRLYIWGSEEAHRVYSQTSGQMFISLWGNEPPSIPEFIWCQELW